MKFPKKPLKFVYDVLILRGRTPADPRPAKKTFYGIRPKFYDLEKGFMLKIDDTKIEILELKTDLRQIISKDLIGGYKVENKKEKTTPMKFKVEIKIEDDSNTRSARGRRLKVRTRDKIESKRTNLLNYFQPERQQGVNNQLRKHILF